MKKFFAFVAAVLFAGSMMAEEGLLFEQTYPGNPTEYTNNYTTSFDITTGAYKLTYACFNNGKQEQAWDAIRCGRKSDASVATITSGAIAESVSKVIVEFTQINASKTNQLALLVADNANFADATQIVQTIAVGEVTFEVAAPAANMYYQISIDMAADGSANGFNRIDKVQFISPDGGTPIVPEVYDTLTVAQAKAICDTLADNATSATKYYVEGYAINVEPYSAQYGNQIFFMGDSATATDTEFEAYYAVPMKDGAAYPVLAGDKVRAFGKMKKYVKDGVAQLELVNPTVEFLEEVEGDRTIEPVGPTKLDTITTAEAVAIAQALPEPAEAGKSTTDTKEVVVRGYAVNVYDKNSDGTWTFNMADEADAYGEFYASNTTTDADVVQGEYMYVKGKIAKRKTNSGKIQLQIYKGTGTHGEAPQGIENVVLTEKAQKVMVDGVLYIVRDGKMFDVRGAQVR